MTASFEIALLVANNKKPHTIAEELIMPAAKVLVKNVIGNEAVSKLNSVSVSNNTIQRRIKEMSIDIKKTSHYGSTGLKIWIYHTTGRINRRVKLRTASGPSALCY